MNRRSFLTTLSAALIGSALDPEKLLWVPGKKTIFLPSLKRLTDSQIIGIELERIAPKIRMLFERDDVFWQMLKSDKRNIISSREITVPLRLKEDE